MPSLRDVRVLVTRPEGQAQTLCDALARAGAIPVPLPLLYVAPVAPDPHVWNDVGAYDWVLFTSSNGVAFGFDAAPAEAREALRTHPRIAAVGPATARVVAERGGVVHRVAPSHVAESLAESLGDVTGARVLWVRGAEARDVLPRTLGARGARVVEAVVYRSVATELDAATCERAAEADVVTLTSPSSARRFVELFGAETRALVACIGPVTADAARALGLRVDAVAEPYTVEGLMNVLQLLPIPERRVA